MPLLTSNTELDLAIERLDPLIAGFPTLLAARHARATAYHRKWLNTVPVQVQRVRASLYTYTARFCPWLTGGTGVGDGLALHRARRDYAAIVDREVIPGTLANLALLDAYAGLFRLALRRARRAARLAPDDPQVRNDLGAVLFLAGDPVAAQEVFLEAEGLPRAREDAAVAFNLARCAFHFGETGAAARLGWYLELDPCSDWRREALILSGEAPDVEGRCLRSAPAVRPGVTLGSSPESVRSGLGAADSTTRRGEVTVSRFEPAGLSIVFSRSRGAVLIELRRPDAGEVDGIRVGEPLRCARARWGFPAERGEGHQVFWNGEWGVGVELDRDGERIAGLSLACRE